MECEYERFDLLPATGSEGTYRFVVKMTTELMEKFHANPHQISFRLEEKAGVRIFLQGGEGQLSYLLLHSSLQGLVTNKRRPLLTVLK